jgi:uncharacterized protein (TIGR00106 family)
MLVVEIAVDPVGTGSTSVGGYVEAAVKVIRSYGYRYQVNPMGTCIEVPSFAALGQLLENIHNELARLGVMRIVTTVRIDDRRDAENSMEKKLSRFTKP